MAESVKFVSENTLKAVVSESKKYSKKVSALTVTTDTTTDKNAAIYNFTQNGEKVWSVKVDTGSDMEEITADEVADMFKEDIMLTFNAAVITVTAKGKPLAASDNVKEGWILTISAPAANPTDSSASLTSITVNGTAVTPLTDNEDNTKKIASYTVVTADEKDGITIAAVYGG